MESFHWDKNFETGLQTVDEQHQHLIKLINQFGNLLAANTLQFNDIEVLFTKLAEYASYHFQTEEEMMGEIGIDQRHVEHHIGEHQGFLNEVTMMHSGISPENPDAAKHLLSFLTHWLAYHILGSDQDMARQIHEIKQRGSPKDAYDTMERSRDGATEPLLRALNGLFQQVSARNRELLVLNQSLEEKVEARTRDLSVANFKLEELANTDVLTGLPNRRHALHQLDTIWNKMMNNHMPLCCMMIDADHFKEINDTYGHDAGDTVLHELAKTLQYSVRTDDIVSRLGGDEFLIICPDTDAQGGAIVAENVRKAVSKLQVSTSGDGSWHGSVSIGLAARTTAMTSYDDLIKAADNSVYEAKRAGKNCVRSMTT